MAVLCAVSLKQCLISSHIWRVYPCEWSASSPEHGAWRWLLSQVLYRYFPMSQLMYAIFQGCLMGSVTTPLYLDINPYMQPSNSVYWQSSCSKNWHTLGSFQYSQFLGHSRITAAFTLLQCSATTIKPDQSLQCKSQWFIRRTTVDCQPFFAAKCWFR